jgi:signal transduction histidine kinase
MGTTAQLAGALRRSLNVVAHPRVKDRVELTRLADEQAALRRVATLVARGAPPDEVFEAVSGEVGRLVGADAAGLGRYETDGTVTVLGYWALTGGHDIRVGTRLALERGTVGMLVFQTRRPGRVNGYEGAPGPTAALARQLRWRSTVGVPVIVDGRLWGFMSAASTSDRLFPLDTEGRLAEFTELVGTALANAENHKVLERLAMEQAALRRVATLVAGGAAPASLLAVVAEEVARVVHVWFVSIARYETDGTATELASFSERGGLFPVGTHWSLEGTNVLATVRESGLPARIDDYSSSEGMIAQTVRRIGIRSTVGIPIIVTGRVWGAMVVSSAEVEPLPETTEARLADFTELVATAIANVESRAELDASRARIVATADATRRRIERDLHDGVQQQLVSLSLELRATRAAVPPELAELRAELSRAVEAQTSVLEGLREIARGIHPAILAEGGLAPALRTLARRSTVPVELVVPVETRLPERVEVAAYYVVSEALANVAKYARASVVHVAVEVRGGLLAISVRDDGEGGADPSRGSGLLGLKDRAEAIGGTLSCESPHGAGTSLQVELPLDDRAAKTQTGARSDAAPLASTRA